MGVSWELLRTSGSTKEGVQIRLGILLGLVCSLLAAEDGLGSVVGLFLARFGCSRGPLKGRNRLDGCQKLGKKKTYNEEKRSSNISF